MMLAIGAILTPDTGPLFTRPADRAWAGLIERMARGEQQALAQLYDQSSRLVFSVVARIVGNQADAEEVTLDVYTQVWKSADGYSAARGTPLAWLTMLARSRALDRVRSRGVRARHETALDAAGDSPARDASSEDAAIFAQQRQRIHAAMAELAPEQREAIEMAFFAGLTHSELAERLGAPLGTIKTRIRSGMMRLRIALGAGKEVQ